MADQLALRLVQCPAVTKYLVVPLETLKAAEQREPPP
ncbi:hypothetical protein SMD44_08833 [Streptomyces alboflavus]|uniref:Uncharacterized protein n=1 Tax=Streptomyces alboflavus TaxID=67267 RepID=A0A1Z1WSD5_9ACTN|nr:hypothetical protein SMD44_08833 [Streptomyces alboflavus]